MCYSTWFIRVGESEGKVFILTNTILYLCHVRPKYRRVTLCYCFVEKPHRKRNEISKTESRRPQSIMMKHKRAKACI